VADDRSASRSGHGTTVPWGTVSGLGDWRWSYERAVSRRRDANAAAAAAANMDDVSLPGSPALVRASR